MLMYWKNNRVHIPSISQSLGEKMILSIILSTYYLIQTKIIVIVSACNIHILSNLIVLSSLLKNIYMNDLKCAPKDIRCQQLRTNFAILELC